ncbi:hypothetical protein ACO34A_04015 [Rhizobium sp. ACO-34A]|nr:hypothetical protein [Rhizobium sp. ACO-34A]ATN32967.1 hypothetical protein ACO34A_04015 [Rhizobium sp. ACO-34A]
MTAKTFLASVLTAVIAFSALPVAAGEIWTMTTPEGTCQISFLQEPVADGVRALLQHDDTCPEALKAVSGYSMSNGDNTIMLYSIQSDLDMIGRADKEEQGLYIGMVGESGLRISKVD